METVNECPICYTELKDIVSCTFQCSHCICAKCKFDGDIRVCPICRENISRIHFNGQHQYFVKDFSGNTLTIEAVDSTTIEDLLKIIAIALKWIPSKIDDLYIPMHPYKYRKELVKDRLKMQQTVQVAAKMRGD